MILSAIALQIYVPRVAAGAIRSAVTQDLHAEAAVQVQGYFWQLAQGSFLRLRMQLGPSSLEGYRLQSLSLRWQEGRIDLQSLLAGQVRVLRPGRLAVRLVMSQDALRTAVDLALRRAIPKGATGSLPAVSVTPRSITLRGSVTFLDLPVRYRVDGDLVVENGGEVLAFQPRDFNDSVLHLPPVPVLRMRDLPRIPGLPLHIVGVRLLKGALAITLAGPR